MPVNPLHLVPELEELRKRQEEERAHAETMLAPVDPGVGMGDVKQADRAFDLLDQIVARPAAKRKPAGTPPPAKPSAPVESDDTVKNYIREKYGLDKNAEALELAQKAAREQVSDSNMGKAISRIGAAFSRGTVKPETQFFDGLAEQSQQGVKEIQQQRTDAKDRMGMDKAAMDMEKLEGDRNPASQESAAVRQMYSSMFPDIVKQIPNFEALSADDIKENFAKPLELKQKSEDNKLRAQQLAQSRKQIADDRLERQQRQQDFNAHTRTVSNLKRDTNLRQQLQKYQNLEGALQVIEGATDLTPEQIHELQQAVRANLGIKGTSGVDERERSYYHTLGWKASDIAQFLTGDPATISKNDPLVKHIKELARIEQDNTRNQYSRALRAASGGHDSVYSRRGDLKEDLDNLVKSLGQQLPEVSAPIQPVANGSTKVINGKSYVKVPGGWVEQ